MKPALLCSLLLGCSVIGQGFLAITQHDQALQSLQASLADYLEPSSASLISKVLSTTETEELRGKSVIHACLSNSTIVTVGDSTMGEEALSLLRLAIGADSMTIFDWVGDFVEFAWDSWPNIGMDPSVQWEGEYYLNVSNRSSLTGLDVQMFVGPIRNDSSGEKTIRLGRYGFLAWHQPTDFVIRYKWSGCPEAKDNGCGIHTFDFPGYTQSVERLVQTARQGPWDASNPTMPADALWMTTGAHDADRIIKSSNRTMMYQDLSPRMSHVYEIFYSSLQGEASALFKAGLKDQFEPTMVRLAQWVTKMQDRVQVVWRGNNHAHLFPWTHTAHSVQGEIEGATWGALEAAGFMQRGGIFVNHSALDDHFTSSDFVHISGAHRDFQQNTLGVVQRFTRAVTTPISQRIEDVNLHSFLVTQAMLNATCPKDHALPLFMRRSR